MSKTKRLPFQTASSKKVGQIYGNIFLTLKPLRPRGLNLKNPLAQRKPPILKKIWVKEHLSTLLSPHHTFRWLSF